MRLRSTHLLLVPAALLAGACASAPRPADAPSLRVRNNHELAYAGPVQVAAALPDGAYRGPGAVATVRGGVVRAVASLAAGAETELVWTGSADADAFRRGALAVTPRGAALDLAWRDGRVASVDLGLVVVPGKEMRTDGVAQAYRPLALAWRAEADGTLSGSADQDGYTVEVTAAPYGGGWLDLRARLTRTAETGAPAYVALVRRVTGPSAEGARLRFNGREFDAAVSPDTWDRDFWYTHGVDWASQRAGAVRLLHVNGFAPAPTTMVDSVWAAGSHFYVWERVRRAGDATYLVSEVAGPNDDQRASGYMRITPYAPFHRGDAVDLKYRVAVTDSASAGWEESQLRAFAGYRHVSADRTVDVGVRSVGFGTSYFPYSTMTENFDFVRTPGLNQETWWPFSPTMWMQWRTFIPRMRTDMRIIRAMGFDWIRLHHLEVLQEMDRAEALAYLDFTVAEAKALGMKVMVDTEGPAEWVALLAARYPETMTRFELENEVLIPGIRPSQPARWTELYRAVKAANPDAQAFFTGAGNNGVFDRLRALNVPFDRVGLHAYKHGPGWEEAYASHVMGTAGYASDLGLEPTLGEFNWKSYTRMSPEARTRQFALLYGEVLETRSIPELFQFHWQETMSVNPRLSRQGVRHYETIGMDRRPKPEAVELMRLIRQYTREDAPVRTLPITVGETTVAGGRAGAPFTVENRTGASVDVTLESVSFDGVQGRIATAQRMTLAAGETAEGRVDLTLPADALPGTYHHFVRAVAGSTESWGWGIASNPGAPRFDPQPYLAGQVTYAQGPASVESLDWGRPTYVVYGPETPVLEMEMAFLLTNTLQSATGRPVRLSTTADLPDSLAARGLVVRVGTAATTPGMCAAPNHPDGHGVIVVRDPQTLCVTGADTRAVEAAANDVVLRFWFHAKDSAIRVTGVEDGALRGNQAGITNADPP